MNQIRAKKDPSKIRPDRRERTRRKLLKAAAEVLAKYGDQKPTIEDFVEAAGVARGTFYNYYATVQDLHEDLWEYVGRDPFRALQDTCASIEGPAERFASKARLVLHLADDNNAWGWVIYSLSRADADVNRDLRMYPRSDLMAALAAQQFNFTDIETATDMTVGTLRHALQTVLLQRQILPVPVYASSITEMLLRAFGVEAEDAEKMVAQTLPVLESG